MCSFTVRALIVPGLIGPHDLPLFVLLPISFLSPEVFEKGWACASCPSLDVSLVSDYYCGLIAFVFWASLHSNYPFLFIINGLFYDTFIIGGLLNYC